MKKMLTFIMSAILIFTLFSTPAEAAKTMWGKVELQTGMVGKIQVLKDTDLYSVTNGKLKFIKKLKKGNEHGVFGDSKSFGGIYKLSGTNVVKKTVAVKYFPVPKPTKKVYSTKEIVDQNDAKIVLIETDVSQGSGIIVGNGLILTNHHVMEDASRATITFNNGQQVEVKGIVESNANKDIALLKTSMTFQTKPVSIRPSSKGLSKGEKVVAIGSPIGLQNSVSEGIISSFRTQNGVTLIQTNADIDHGSSGGALFDTSGQLIGMTSSGYDDVNANLNFAIATEVFMPLLNKYSKTKYDSIKASFPVPAAPAPAPVPPAPAPVPPAPAPVPPAPAPVPPAPSVPTVPTIDIPVPGLQNISLGMTRQQVSYLSGGTYMSEDNSSLFFKDVLVFGLPAGVVYNFENNKLVSLSVFHSVVKNTSKVEILESYFSVMYNELSRIYGKAAYIDNDWLDDENSFIKSAFWTQTDRGIYLSVNISMDGSTYGGFMIGVN